MPIRSEKSALRKKKTKKSGKKEIAPAVSPLDTFDIYLRDIRGYPPLKKEEEMDLATRIQNGDDDAREKLVKHNLRFVISVAKKYKNRGLTLAELVTEGNSGLLRAADKFDPSKGIKFISFAVWWIRQAILMAISKSIDVPEPQNVATMRKRINKFCDSYYVNFGEYPPYQLIAEAHGIEVEEVGFYLGGGTLSLDEVLRSQGNNPHTLYDVFADKAESPFESAANNQEVELVLETLEELVSLGIISSKHREIFLIRRGFENVHGHPVLVSPEGPTLEAIGRQFGCTREWIRQMYEKTVSRLQYALKHRMSQVEMKRLL